MPKVLSSKQIADALKDLPGWTGTAKGLSKTFAFGSFREAFAFMTRVAFEAEALNHHPDWTNVYQKVTVRLSTHEAGGKVTALDVELARKIQAISWVG